MTCFRLLDYGFCNIRLNCETIVLFSYVTMLYTAVQAQPETCIKLLIEIKSALLYFYIRMEWSTIQPSTVLNTFHLCAAGHVLIGVMVCVCARQTTSTGWLCSIPTDCHFICCYVNNRWSVIFFCTGTTRPSQAAQPTQFMPPFQLCAEVY